jgi:hypothetical protein
VTDASATMPERLTARGLQVERRVDASRLITLLGDEETVTFSRPFLRRFPGGSFNG